MDERLHKQLIADSEKLRALVGECSTETVAGSVASQFLKWPDEEIGLSSPQRQLFYLLGLMLTTQNPSHPKEFDNLRWEKSQKLLEHIFSAYAWMYWPTPEEAGRIDVNWHRARKVAMPAFLHYFNSGLLASTLQIKDRIRRYLIPFDNEIHQLLGISVSEMLKVTDSLARFVQRDFDSLTECKKQEEYARSELLDRAQKGGWNKERIRIEVGSSSYGEAYDAFIKALQKASKIKYQELEKVASIELARYYWELFIARRGKVGEFKYLTEVNPAEDKPIFLLNETSALVPSVHSVYLAVLSKVERMLLNSKYRASFLRRRDRELQEETASQFRKFFSEKAQILTSVYETPDQQFEHDIVVRWERKIFVIEAKASPPVEPFRDPDKAFTRIKRAFASDRGLQKAYDQAHQIETAFNQGQVITLYNRQGTSILKISKPNVERIYCICVSRDNFGMLASNLSLLLRKEATNVYPWAVNVLDLEALFDAFSYFNWGPERFCEYLEGREKMHGKINAGDEMEFVGFLIEHGTFDWFFKESFDRMALNPSYTDVLTRIHHARLGGAQVEYKPHPPVTKNLSAEVMKWDKKAESFKENPPLIVRPKKQGRNEPCACGSGKKYKHCCGR